MRQRLLVTGSTGLLGLSVVLEAASVYDVVGMVHKRKLRVPGVQEVHADVCDGDATVRLVEEVAPDLVVNTAALVSPDACEADPELATLMNVKVPAALADCCSRIGARFVHISTDSIYGDAGRLFTESTPPQPQSVYARTKLAGEEAALQAFPEALVVRTNFFGWSSSGDRSLAEFFIGRLRVGSPVPGFTDVEFTPLYQRDLSALILRAAEHEISGVRNMGSSQPLSKFDFGRAIAEMFGFDVGLVRPASRHDAGLKATRSAHLSMDSGQIASDLSIDLPTAREGITRMRDDYRDGYAQAIWSGDRTVDGKGVST